MLRTAWLALLLIVPCVVAEEVKVQVLRDGKPAKGATVRLAITKFVENQPTHELTAPVKVDDTGYAVFQKELKFHTYTVYANDADGLFGASRSMMQAYGPLADVTTIELAKPATCSGRMIDTQGKAIAGVELTFRAAMIAKPTDRDEEIFQYIRLDPLETSSTKTDEQGRYKFALMPAGRHATVQFRSEKYGRGTVRLDSKENNDVVLAEAGSLKMVYDSPDAKPADWTLWLRGNIENAKDLGTITGHHLPAVGMEMGSYVSIVPGTYRIEQYRVGASPRIPELPQTVEIKAGQRTVLNIKTTEAASLTGRLVDKANGKGLAETRVAIQGLGTRFFESVTTDKDGRYTSIVPGDNKFTLYMDSNLHVGDRIFELPKTDKKLRRTTSGFVPDATVKPGEQHEFPTLELREALTIRGKVERADKKPFKGNCDIEFAVYGQYARNNPAKWMPHDTGITLRLRQGNAVNIPERIDAEKLKEVQTYTISEANAVTVTGSVRDQNERGVSGVKVQLHWGRSQEGQSDFSSMSSQVAKFTTNPDGAFTFTGCWPNEQYHITAEDPRFGKVGDNINGSRSAGPGKILDFGSYTVKIPEKNITGTVLHVDGTPVVGATVQTTGDTPKTMTTTTDDNGKFEIKNLPKTKLFVTATKAGYRHTYVACDTAKGTAALVLRKQSEDPAPPPAKADDLEAKRKNATHEMLELLWVTRANHNWGPSVVGYALRFNEKLVQKWIDEAPLKEAEGLKSQLAANINNIELMALAKKDINKAIQIVRPGRDEVYWKFLEVGEMMLPVDKVIALRFAEEALMDARKDDPSRKAYLPVNLAKCAALMHRAGDEANAKKLFDEAFQLISEIKSSKAPMRAWVAEQLGKVDLPAAIEQFKEVNDDYQQNTSFSRLLVFIAKTNPQKAIDNLKNIRKEHDGSFRCAEIPVAVAIADREPVQAIKLIEGLKNKREQVRGYMELAKALRTKDEKTAWELIDKAFAAMDDGADDFSTWINFGGRPAAAAQVASVARQIGHPDVHSLVARTLAYREKESIYKYDYERSIDFFLLGLSLADPESVRWMLQARFTEEELLQKSTSGRRNLLFILAMVDPPLCKKAVEQYMAGVKKQGFGNPGIIELLGSLTTKGEEFESLGAWQALFFGKLERE
jgi:hypothetical protein